MAILTSTAPTGLETTGCQKAAASLFTVPFETGHLRFYCPTSEDVTVLRQLSGFPTDMMAASRENLINQSGHFAWIIEDRLHRRLAGLVFGNFFTKDRVEIGCYLLPEQLGKNYDGEAIARCLRLLFDGSGVKTISARVSQSDYNLKEIFEKQGFVKSDKPDIWEITLEFWLQRRKKRPLLLVAAAALIDVDGRVLLAQRPDGKSLAGQWEFPGGKIEDGETPEESLIRELKEELDIDVSQSCLAPLAFASHDYDDFYLLMPLFACRQWHGKPTPREGQIFSWVNKTKLDKYLLPPADIPLIAILRDWL